ncbi:MAG: Ig-like domain-containing protein, partial [Faecousia sp.]
MKVKKQALSWILVLSIVLTVLLAGIQVWAGGLDGMQLYVSPNGDDSAAGTFLAPLKTLEGARNKIREIKASSGLPEGGITVNLRAGDYKILEDSFRLEAQDSGEEGKPIVYQAYPGETVTITGNAEAKGSDFQQVTDEEILARLPESVRDQVLVYDVTEKLGLTSFSPIPKNGYGWPDQPSALNITVDGEAQTLSRYPNDGFVKIDTAYSTGFIPRNHQSNPDGSCPECTKANDGTRIPCQYGEDTFAEQAGGVWGSKALASKYDLWKQETDIWTFGYFRWDWADDNCGISKVELDGEYLKLTGAQPSRYGVNSGMKFYAYNLLCEIDQPGEWYLDRDTGKLYLYPTKDISSSTVELSIMGQPFIYAENAQYIQFKNLDISKGNSHGIQMVDCNNMLVAGCDFSDLGQRAVVIGEIISADAYEKLCVGSRGGHDNIVQSCNIVRTGQGGVFLAGGNRYTLTEANSKVVNCYFNDYAVIKRTYSPAIQLSGVGLEASNNKIENAPHMAIGFDGNENIIKNNDISNVCYETSDSGAIYSVRRWSFRGNVITNNYIHDMVPRGGIGSAAVYLDDLMAGTEVSNNLFVNISGYTTLIGGGRDNIITNNIQINYNNDGKGLDYDARGLGWAYYHAASPDGTCYAEWLALKNNPKLDTAKWQEKYPELMNMSLELNSSNVCIEGQKPAGAVITGNLLVGVANPFGNINSNVTSMGTVKENESFVAGTDIGFEDPDALNFNVKEDSIIKQKLGDEHFQASECGLYMDEYRTTLGVEVDAPVLTAPEKDAEDLSAVEGITLQWQAVEGAGNYKVELSEGSSFETVLKTVSTKDTSLNLVGLDLGKTYYWRVTAYEERLNGSSAVSEVRSFTTSTSTDVHFYESFGNDFSAWTPADGKGSPSNTTDQAHAGRFSYVLDEQMDVIQKTFGIPQKQVVTLWMYDNMTAGYYLQVVANVIPGTEGWAAIGISGAKSTTHYSIRVGSAFTPTDVPRSEGWHELKWDYTSGTDCKMYIDGILVHTLENVNGFQTIQIGDFWNHSNYPCDVSGIMFDDVKIGNPVIEPVPSEITLDKTTIMLEVDKQMQLHAVATANPDVDVVLEWTQGEHEIARVDENGVVTGVRPGTTKVIVSVEGYPEVKAECEVVVVEKGGIPVDEVKLNYSTAELQRYNTLQLLALITPDNASNQDIVWTSNNPVVADVDSNGKVYARGVGEAVITATVDGKSASCTVTVLSDIPDLPNFSFETGDLTGWSKYPGENEGTTIVVQKGDAHHGEYAAYIVTTDRISGYVYKGVQYQLQNPSADASYTLRAWVKVMDDKAHEMGIFVAIRANKNDNIVPTSKIVSAEDGWVQIETTITAEQIQNHPGTYRLDFIIGNKNDTASAGAILVDDVELIVERATYDVTVSGGNGGGAYPSGTEVLVKAEIPACKTFVKWIAEGIELADETNPEAIFEMPSGAVKLTAVYADSHESLSKVDAKEPTCTEDGNVEYWHCETCGKNYADAEGNTELNSVVDPKGHSLTHVEAKEPTCTEDGNVEHWHCKTCGKNYADAEGNTELNSV